jgi:uncharacterized membrane protein YdjX (TVP38/TMEM64 family)
MNAKSAARIALVGAVASAALGAFFYREHLTVAGLQAWLDGLGKGAPLALLGVWLVAPVLMIPGAPITIAAGALFGPLWGAVYSVVGATGGATLAFLLARYVRGEWVERWAGGRLGQIVAGVDSEGWRFVAFVRLIPLFPFNLLNYALGLTRIPLPSYVAATLVCMIPGAAGYAYLGHAGKAAVLGTEGWLRHGASALAFLAVLLLVPLMVRHWRSHRALVPGTLARWLREGHDVCVVDVRTREQYHGEDGRIDPSLLIPIDELERRLDELSAFRGRPVVVV